MAYTIFDNEKLIESWRISKMHNLESKSSIFSSSHFNTNFDNACFFADPAHRIDEIDISRPCERMVLDLFLLIAQKDSHWITKGQINCILTFLINELMKVLRRNQIYYMQSVSIRLKMIAKYRVANSTSGSSTRRPPIYTPHNQNQVNISRVFIF